MSLVRRLHGLVFGYVLVFTFLVGVLVIITIPCLLMLLLRTRRLYRAWSEFWTSSVIMLILAWLEIVWGTKVFIDGDYVPRSEKTLVIMNHRTRIDWMMFWMFALRFGRLNNAKISLKDEVRKIPGFGWGMQSVPYLFLTRNWEKDEQHISSMLSYFKQTSYPLQLLLFPEGTDLAERSKRNSDKFAQANGLPYYNYVLHPRTKGFQHIMTELGESIDSVVDLTVGYPVNIVSREAHLLSGKFPKEVHLYVRRYSRSSLPADSEGLVTWCNKLWKGKEDILERFYRTKEFHDPVSEREQRGNKSIPSCYDSVTRSRVYNMTITAALVFWLAFNVTFTTLVFLCSTLRWIFLALVLVNLVVTHIFGGYHILELAAFHRPAHHGRLTKHS